MAETDATPATRSGGLPPAQALPSSVAASGQDRIARTMRRRGDESKFWWLVPTIYIVFLILPIYWLINMSFKTRPAMSPFFRKSAGSDVTKLTAPARPSLP